MNQKYTSANTSINKTKIPKIYNIKSIANDLIEKHVVDIGGGKYDNAIKYAKEKYNCDVSVYDPFNQTELHNREVLSKNYDIALCSNVLNVICSEEIRLDTIRLALQHAPIVYITVYQGNKTGIGKESKKDCWQENRPLKDYIKEIEKIDRIKVELFTDYIKVLSI